MLAMVFFGKRSAKYTYNAKEISVNQFSGINYNQSLE
jgi:hypothetical protein